MCSRLFSKLSLVNIACLARMGLRERSCTILTACLTNADHLHSEFDCSMVMNTISNKIQIFKHIFYLFQTVFEISPWCLVLSYWSLLIDQWCLLFENNIELIWNVAICASNDLTQQNIHPISYINSNKSSNDDINIWILPISKS